jgi:hypothetical protein
VNFNHLLCTVLSVSAFSQLSMGFELLANSAVQIVFSSKLRLFLLSFFHDLLMVVGFPYIKPLPFNMWHKLLPDHLKVVNSHQLFLEMSWSVIHFSYLSMPLYGLSSERKNVNCNYEQCGNEGNFPGQKS